MQFTGLVFLLVFLPVSLLLYYISGTRVKPYILLCMNLLFYALGQINFLLLLCLFTIFNACIVMALGRIGAGKLKLLLLIIGVAANIGLLACYKYSSDLLLPLGISFYTFKAVSVIADTYKGKAAIKSPLDVINYMLFFGQIQSGPISRYEAKGSFGGEYNLKLFSCGILHFMVGFSKKILIADVLVRITNEVFFSKELSMPYAWLGALCFSLQLYYDFSGYSDMAVGLSNMFGISCGENFNYPYATASIGEFWRRWHISLGAWFRDYVYIPLGGSRVSRWRLIFNLGIVWLLTGIWHGNTGGFLIWGLTYFLLIAFEKVTGCPARLKSRGGKVIYRIFSLIMINFLWVLFYFGNIADAFSFIKNMLAPSEYNISVDRAYFLFNSYKVFIIAAIIFAVPIVPAIMKLSQKNRAANIASNVIYGFLITGFFILSIAIIAGKESNPFLYIGF